MPLVAKVVKMPKEYTKDGRMAMGKVKSVPKMQTGKPAHDMPKGQFRKGM